LPRCKLAGQHPPLASGFEKVEDRVEDVSPQVMSAASVGLKVRLYGFPLGVRQVRAIALLTRGFGNFIFGMSWLFTPKMRRALGGFPDGIGQLRSKSKHLLRSKFKAYWTSMRPTGFKQPSLRSRHRTV
jgi:hypothetical protein